MRKTAAMVLVLTVFLVPILLLAEKEFVPVPEGPPAVKLTLADCIGQALDKNPQMQVAKSQIDTAEGQANATKANAMPKLTWSANMVHASGLPEFTSGKATTFPLSMPVSDANGDPAAVAPHTHLLAFPSLGMTNTREGNIYGAKIEGTQPLFTGGKIINGIDAAMLEIRVSEEGVKNSKINIISAVEQAFYGALLAKEMVGVLEDAIKTAKARYKWIQDLYEEGMVSNLDLLQVEARVAALEPLLIDIKNKYQLALVGIKALMNVDPNIPIELDGSLDYKPEPVPDLNAMIEEALQNRPDVRTMIIRKSQAEKLLGIARAGYMPTVAGFANYQWNMGQEIPPNEKTWRESWQAGVAVSMPIYDGGAFEGNVQAAQSRVQQAEEGRRGMELLAHTEVESAILNIRKAEEQIVARKVSIEAAEKNYQVAEDRYKVGLANNLEVMDAEMALTQAKGDYLSAVFEYLFAQSSLRKATGLSIKEEQ